jgi:hypothetical protein
LLGPALQLAAAFNLVCAGTLRTGPVGLALPEASGAPFTITYRIDLASRLWCADACAAQEPLADVNSDQIILRETHDPQGGNTIAFTPATGRFTDTVIVGTEATLRSGVCQVVAFTGFPVRVV